MKEAGFRLVDDVTKLNTSLINRLVTHENIDSAWFSMGVSMGKPRRAGGISSGYTAILEGLSAAMVQPQRTLRR